MEASGPKTLDFQLQRATYCVCCAAKLSLGVLTRSELVCCLLPMLAVTDTSWTLPTSHLQLGSPAASMSTGQVTRSVHKHDP